MNMKTLATITAALAASSLSAFADKALTKSIAEPDLVFEEKDGFVAVEAEHFLTQEKDEVRAWYLTTFDNEPELKPDADPNHVAGASGGAYLEILPDTRKNHGEKLITGENFINQPGKMAVLSYKVHFNTPGKYYVWVRTHSTGTEDNGLHVGIDGTWPESGQRMQWTGKRNWVWGSKQRTEKVHTGVPGILFLNVEKPGEHIIHFSMREDGFEFDQWMMTTKRVSKIGDEIFRADRVKAGKKPAPFKLVTGAGRTLIYLDEKNLKESPSKPATEDVPKASTPVAGKTNANPAMRLGDFGQGEQVYVDQGKWFAVNPDQHKSGKASGAWPFRAGTFDLTFHAVGENDGQSTYTISVEG
jgi:hypothetical protein